MTDFIITKNILIISFLVLNYTNILPMSVI